MEEDDVDTYSSPDLNYRRLIDTIQKIEDGLRITEDWVEEHKRHIFKYREIFPNFAKVNEEFEDSEFRKKALESEMIIVNLVHEIHTRNTFNVKFYLILNKHMKAMLDCIQTEDDLANMVCDMSM